MRKLTVICVGAALAAIPAHASATTVDACKVVTHSDWARLFGPGHTRQELSATCVYISGRDYYQRLLVKRPEGTSLARERASTLSVDKQEWWARLTTQPLSAVGPGAFIRRGRDNMGFGFRVMTIRKGWLVNVQGETPKPLATAEIVRFVNAAASHLPTWVAAPPRQPRRLPAGCRQLVNGHLVCAPPGCEVNQSGMIFCNTPTEPVEPVEPTNPTPVDPGSTGQG